MKPKRFDIGDIVYFTAFLRKDKDKFYLCKGQIKEVCEGKPLRFRVMVEAVGDRSVGNKSPTTRQKALLSLAITKKKTELHGELPQLLAPKEWLHPSPSP